MILTAKPLIKSHKKVGKVGPPATATVEAISEMAKVYRESKTPH